jgi:hypothetical protein
MTRLQKVLLSCIGVLLIFLVCALPLHAQFGPSNATKLRGRAISGCVPTDGQVLVWVALTKTWTCGDTSGSVAVATVTNNGGALTASHVTVGNAGVDIKVTPCTIDASGNLSCLTVTTTGAVTSEADFVGATSGNVVAVKASDTTAAGVLTLPGTTGTLTAQTGAVTTAHLAVWDSSGRLIDGGVVPSAGTSPVAGYNIRGLAFPFDGGGSAIAVNSVRYLHVPFACTIAATNIVVDTGTLTVKFWKIASGTAHPTVSNVLNTSGISLSTGTALHTTTVSDFSSTSVTADDFMAATITAISGTTNAHIDLQCNQ